MSATLWGLPSRLTRVPAIAVRRWLDFGNFRGQRDRPRQDRIDSHVQIAACQFDCKCSGQRRDCAFGWKVCDVVAIRSSDRPIADIDDRAAMIL